MDYLLDRTTTGIIEQLEARLQRIEYVTIGHLDKSVLNDNKRSVYVRLGDLEHGLNQLVSKSRVIQDLLKLHARYPNFFHISEPWDVSPSLDIMSKSSIILAAASSFHQTASRLTSVNDTPLPAAESSTELIDVAARATKIEVLQGSQSLEIAALKQRTAAMLQQWYSVGIMQVGECWADLEARVEYVEQAIRQVSSSKQYEGGPI